MVEAHTSIANRNVLESPLGGSFGSTPMTSQAVWTELEDLPGVGVTGDPPLLKPSLPQPSLPEPSLLEPSLPKPSLLGQSLNLTLTPLTLTVPEVMGHQVGVQTLGCCAG